MAPGENKSAGKQKTSRCRKGNKALLRVLTEAAWAISHTKKGYLRAFYQRVKARRGWPKGILATDHKILVIALRVLKTGTPYIEPAGDYFDRLNPGLVQRLEALGHRVQLVPIKAV